MTNFFSIPLLYLLILSTSLFAQIKVGVGKYEITPPIGAPSAGSFERNSGMTAIHDPLFALAMVIHTQGKLVAFCSVDHLGFTHAMVEEVKKLVHQSLALQNCEIFISATHTHSGGGGYLNIPGVGEWIAGPYDSELAKMYVEGAAKAIIQAASKQQPAKIGIGIGKVNGLTTYAGMYPEGIEPPTDLTLIKVTKEDGSPLVAFFHYSLYPDILVYALPDDLNATHHSFINAFSADVVGYARKHVEELIGEGVMPIFFNGPKGELLAKVPFPEDRFKSCDSIGKTLAEHVKTLWDSTLIKEDLEISTKKHSYLFEAKPTPSGFLLPVDPFETEINLIVFDKTYAFVTIPAELSCSYDPVIKEKSKQVGFKNLCLFDLTNDAHGYIFSPESWRLHPEEVEFSWGGEMYGKILEDKIVSLLHGK